MQRSTVKKRCLFSIRTLIPHYTCCVLSSHCTVRADRDSTCILSLMSELINPGIIWNCWFFTSSICSPAEIKSNMNFYHLNISTKKFLLRLWCSQRSRSVSSCCWSESGVLLASVTILFSANQIGITQSEGERACAGHEVEKWHEALASPKASPFHLFCRTHRQRW